MFLIYLSIFFVVLHIIKTIIDIYRYHTETYFTFVKYDPIAIQINVVNNYVAVLQNNLILNMINITNTNWKRHVKIDTVIYALKDYLNEVKLEIYNKIEDSDDVYIEIDLKDHLEQGSELICNEINKGLIEKDAKFRLIYHLRGSLGIFNLVYFKEQSFIEVTSFYKKVFSIFGDIDIWKLYTIYGDTFYLIKYNYEIHKYLIEKKKNSLYYRFASTLNIINHGIINNEKQKYILTDMY